MQITKSILSINWSDPSIHLEQLLIFFMGQWLPPTLTPYFSPFPILRTPLFVSSSTNYPPLLLSPSLFIGNKFCRLIASWLSSSLRPPSISHFHPPIPWLPPWPRCLCPPPSPRHPSLPASPPFPFCRPQLFALPLFIHFSLFALMRLTGHTHTKTPAHIPKQKTGMASLWGVVNVGPWIDPSSGFHDAKPWAGAVWTAGQTHPSASVSIKSFSIKPHLDLD